MATPLMHDSGNSDLVLCNNIEGWDGVRGGREVREGENIRIPIAGCC